MRKRILSGCVALCMLATMAPAAFAADDATPAAASISISSTGGQIFTSVSDGNALRLTIPNDAVLDLASIGMTTTEAVTLGNVSGSGSNTIYADGENLKITLSVKGMAYTVTAEMSTSDNTNWTGEGDVPSIEGVTDLAVGALANELGDTDISVAEGVLVADGQNSVAAKVSMNQDASNVYMYLYPASSEVYEINFAVGNTTYTFDQPAGTTIFAPQGLESPGSELAWYTDTTYSDAAQFGGTVTGDMTFYGRYESDTQTSFAEQLAEENLAVLTINNAEDFGTFAARASEVDADQIVRLNADLDLEDATYPSISGFKGDFDGNCKTISNASFTVVNGNAGMFATLGAGQVVANLNLSNITVNQSSATYSGTLVGSASGVESAGSGQVTIQNVQVSDSTVRGRSAGGIAGFIIWTDVKYCSVTGGSNMDITGTVNAGGIVGISYNNVSDCYVIATPKTTLPFLNDIGGIVAKNLDNVAHISHCWTTYDVIASQMDNPSIVTDCLESVGRRTEASDLEDLGFNETYWALADGTDSHFTDAVKYEFA